MGSTAQWLPRGISWPLISRLRVVHFELHAFGVDVLSFEVGRLDQRSASPQFKQPSSTSTTKSDAMHEHPNGGVGIPVQ